MLFIGYLRSINMMGVIEMRLIDADALKKYLDYCAFCKSCPNKNKGNDYCTLDCKFPDYCDDEWKRVIDEQPTIDERKTGRWIFGETMGHSWMKCSECCKSQDGQTLCFTYCPFCGAKMKGAEDD